MFSKAFCANDTISQLYENVYNIAINCERGVSMAKNSPAKIQANNRYTAKAYDRIQVVVPKGRKADVEAHAKSKGESVNGLINALLRADMKLSEDEWKK